MTSSQVLFLVIEKALIKRVNDRIYVIHPSLENGRQLISPLVYWATFKKCRELGIDVQFDHTIQE